MQPWRTSIAWTHPQQVRDRPATHAGTFHPGDLKSDVDVVENASAGFPSSPAAAKRRAGRKTKEDRCPRLQYQTQNNSRSSKPGCAITIRPDPNAGCLQSPRAFRGCSFRKGSPGLRQPTSVVSGFGTCYAARSGRPPGRLGPDHAIFSSAGNSNLASNERSHHVFWGSCHVAGPQEGKPCRPERASVGQNGVCSDSTVLGEFSPTSPHRPAALPSKRPGDRSFQPGGRTGFPQNINSPSRTASAGFAEKVCIRVDCRK